MELALFHDNNRGQGQEDQCRTDDCQAKEECTDKPIKGMKTWMVNATKDLAIAQSKQALDHPKPSVNIRFA
jgi:hypothetical protein